MFIVGLHSGTISIKSQKPVKIYIDNSTSGGSNIHVATFTGCREVNKAGETSCVSGFMTSPHNGSAMVAYYECRVSDLDFFSSFDLKKVTNSAFTFLIMKGSSKSPTFTYA